MKLCEKRLKSLQLQLSEGCLRMYHSPGSSDGNKFSHCGSGRGNHWIKSWVWRKCNNCRTLCIWSWCSQWYLSLCGNNGKWKYYNCLGCHFITLSWAHQWSAPDVPGRPTVGTWTPGQFPGRWENRRLCITRNGSPLWRSMIPMHYLVARVLLR